MEQSLSSLAFKGSLEEAISEVLRQKKLFVVYTASDDPESNQLETSTWIDLHVCETLAKYCILLHILEGSSEASKFSEKYPQPSAPCITAVGYNGLQVWQKEGFVSADVLASSLEKAHFSVLLQETLLAAARASEKQVPAGTSMAASSEKVTPETDDNIPSRGVGQSSHSETIEDKNDHEDTSQACVASPELSPPNTLDTGELESTSNNESRNTSRDPIEIDEKKPVPEKNLNCYDSNLCSSNEVSREIIGGASEMSHANTEGSTEVEKTDSAIKSNDVFLNIRLPDGHNLQVKFSLNDTLRMVKDYIEENKTSSFGSYSIAISYPLKVFSDQDLVSTLSELGLVNRQALIVVPQKQENLHYGGGSLQNQTFSANDVGPSNTNEGSWASVKRMLSYVNPFSYLSRSANSPSTVEESPSGMWQYNPNPSLRNTLHGGVRPSTVGSSDQSTSTCDRNSNRKQTPRFGGNIHTLKHDEDDDSRFNDRNAFWNGNSTQYGGNNDGN